MTPFYKIVSARTRDVHLIGAIELAAATLLRGHAPNTVLNQTTPEQDLRDAQSQGRLWVALAGDTPVGFAHVEVLEVDAAHLEEIDVHPDHGRRGLGRRLIAEVCGWADEQGYPAVTLTTFRAFRGTCPLCTARFRGNSNHRTLTRIEIRFSGRGSSRTRPRAKSRHEVASTI